MTNSMQAVVIPRFGNADVLEVQQLPLPQPDSGQIALEVAYAGVNFAEVIYRRGFVPHIPLPFVPGIEASGRVVALGEGVTEFSIGERVAAFLTSSGGYGQRVVTNANVAISLDRLAPNLSLAVAAAAPSNLATAYLVMTEVARLRLGEAVLVHAATGGVGSALGQMAHALGAGEVIGTIGSEQKRDYAHSLGYNRVLLRTEFKQLLLAEGKFVDVVCDQVGGTARRDSLEVLNPLGKLVIMGNASDAQDVNFTANEIWTSGKSLCGFVVGSLAHTRPALVKRALEESFKLLASGDLRVDVAGTYPLSHAIEAHRQLEEATVLGKLVLEVNG